MVETAFTWGASCDDDGATQPRNNVWQFVDGRGKAIEPQLEKIGPAAKTQGPVQVVSGKNHTNVTWLGCCFDDFGRNHV